MEKEKSADDYKSATAFQAESDTAQEGEAGMKRIALGIPVKGNGNETDFRRHKASSIRTVISDRILGHDTVPYDRRIFGCAFRVPHGGGPCDVRLPPRVTAENAFERHHPVRGADSCRDSLHDRVYRRCEVRVLKAIPHADKRFALYPRQGDWFGSLRRTCADIRYRNRARDLLSRFFAV